MAYLYRSQGGQVDKERLTWLPDIVLFLWSFQSNCSCTDTRGWFLGPWFTFALWPPSGYLQCLNFEMHTYIFSHHIQPWVAYQFAFEKSPVTVVVSALLVLLWRIVLEFCLQLASANVMPPNPMRTPIYTLLWNAAPQPTLNLTRTHHHHHQHTRRANILWYLWCITFIAFQFFTFSHPILSLYK